MSTRMCVLQRDNDQLAELVGRLTCTLQVCTTPCVCCIKHVCTFGGGDGGWEGDPGRIAGSHTLEPAAETELVA